ncbi:O-antigen ligase family protein [Bacteroides oleiciplenus]|nr:O-antigen ligase family protein [Bacteroides oleiciplenus]
MKIELLNKVLVILICLFYILSSVINTYIPGILKMVQIVTIVIALLLIPLLLKKDEKVNLFILLYAFLFLLLVPLFSSGSYLNTINSLSFLLNVFMGFILWKQVDFTYSLLRVIFIINCIALILETFFQIKFVLISEDYDTSAIEHLYKMGIFSAPKNGGFFILAVALLSYLRKDIFILILGFIFSLFTGVRIASVAIGLPLVYMLLCYLLKGISWKKILLLFVIFCICYFALCAFFTENELVLRRLSTSMDLEDGSNTERFYFWKAHWDYFWSQSIEQILWGNSAMSDLVIGNGPECAFLDVLNRAGFLVLMFFLSPLFFILICNIYHLSPLLILIALLSALISGRFAMGFSEGIIYWCLVFQLLSSCPQLSKLSV